MEKPFSPEDLDIMGKALTAAVAKLGLPAKDPMIETAARRIVRAALAGERNIFKLTEIGAGGRDPEPGSFLQ